MASFDDVARALACAAAIQEGFDDRNAASGAPELRVRIGVAAGEPVDHNDDLFGSTVNLASRICEAAEAGQTLVSELVHDLGIKEGFSFGGAETRVLRGFPGPTVVFELEQTPAGRPCWPMPSMPWPASPSSRCGRTRLAGVPATGCYFVVREPHGDRLEYTPCPQAAKRSR